MKDASSRPSRRQFLKSVTAGAAAVLTSDLRADETKKSAGDLIRRENEKPGTRDWLLTNTRIDAATKYRCPWIEGYCSHTSIRAGETLKFFVSTNPASDFTLEVFRLGYYGGDGARLVHQFGSFKGVTQPDPPIGPKRVRDCAWEPCAEFKIPADWLSGVYLGRLTEQREKLQSYVIFIVRDDRSADYLYQCSDTTWQAYNRWPNQFSLYDDGEEVWYWGGDVQVSFNRPYGKYGQLIDQPLSIGSGDFLMWEFPFVFWLEQHGFDVSYISNLDTHRDPGGLLRARGFLSVGHDEYWSREMFDNVHAAVGKGVSAGFFSGNTCCGRILFDKNVRAFERVGVYGPPHGTREYVKMSTLPHERPYANELVGAHTTGPVTGNANWVCMLPEHWIFGGTGMKKGDGIQGLVGWEFNGDPASIDGLEIVATSSTNAIKGKPNGGVFTATIYPGKKKNIVFNAATCWWADGLSEPPGYKRAVAVPKPLGPDRRVGQITRNILERMAGRA